MKVKVKEIVINAAEAYLDSMFTEPNITTRHTAPGDMQYNIIKHDKYTVIAVCGTQFIKEGFDLRNYLCTKDGRRNLKLWPWYTKATGHGVYGYVTGAVSIVGDLFDKINTETPIILTGHSSGAPVSYHVARALYYAGYNVAGWAGLGGPKSTWIRNALPLFPAWNFRNQDDIGTQLWPPLRQPMRLAHIGHGGGGLIGKYKDHDKQLYVRNCPHEFHFYID